MPTRVLAVLPAVVAVWMSVAVGGWSGAAEPADTGAWPRPLREGVPGAWLIGGIHDGRGGNDIYGLDTDPHLNPNPGQPYLSSEMMGGRMRAWEVSPTTPDGRCVIVAKTDHSYGWSRGTGYAHLYLHADADMQAILHLQQSGIASGGWLDGQAVAFAEDRDPPADFPRPGQRQEAELEGLTTEGLRMTALPEQVEPPQRAVLDLSAGWHRLMVKMTMQHGKGETFFFAARFTDASGRPVQGLQWQCHDPQADLALNLQAARIRPCIFVEAPGNLPRAGEPLKVRASMRWHPVREEPEQTSPIPPFEATLRITLSDFDGKELAVREVRGTFPAEVTLDFGAAPATGYYTLRPQMISPEGRRIMTWWADGFTVAPGSVAQKERLGRKKLWNNNYYFFDDEARGLGIPRTGELMNWLERSGVWRNIGSAVASTAPQDMALWEEATMRGIELFADTAGDTATTLNSPAELEQYVAAVAPYTRYFKCVNEIDIHAHAPGFDELRQPRNWVDRARREYETVHRARPDAHYLGGSLVRPGDMRPSDRAAAGILGPGEWFVECLKLGLDRYHDAWDVHAYPQNPPRLNGPLGNSGVEDERGVLAAYERVGRQNKLPFWLGETGAKAAHGPTGRRWQADQAAKLIAWVNHRADYLGIAFCIGNEYDWARGRLWDYSMGHKPGEAAMITAGALIDGLPYEPVPSDDASIQIGRFGPTFMIWRADDRTAEYRLQLDVGGPWVIVNVVGHKRPLEVDDGAATFAISSSPVYVLPEAEYERLTRLR